MFYLRLVCTAQLITPKDEEVPRRGRFLLLNTKQGSALSCSIPQVIFLFGLPESHVTNPQGTVSRAHDTAKEAQEEFVRRGRP